MFEKLNEAVDKILAEDVDVTFRAEALEEYAEAHEKYIIQDVINELETLSEEYSPKMAVLLKLAIEKLNRRLL